MEFRALGVTLGIAFVSAFIPIFNIEIYLANLVEREPEVIAYLAAAMATIGQMAGKLVFYAAGRGAFRMPNWMHRKTEKQRAGRFARWLRKFHDAAENRPVLSAVVLFISAVFGIPPFAAMSVLAGIAEIRLWIFLVTGISGRYIRFAVIALIPSLIDFWIF